MITTNLCTFGHSTLPLWEAEVHLLANDVDILVDVRSHPGSKAHPQWNLEALDRYFRNHYIDYRWLPELGGWTASHATLAAKYRPFGVDVDAYVHGHFPKQRIGKDRPDPDAQSPSWTNQGLWDYQWFMTTDDFRIGIDRLLELSSTRRVAFMCCELLWWKCHRSMIADYLTFCGHPVTHLQPKLTAHGPVSADRFLRYHPGVLDVWSSWSH